MVIFEICSSHPNGAELNVEIENVHAKYEYVLLFIHYELLAVPRPTDTKIHRHKLANMCERIVYRRRASPSNIFFSAK